MVLYISIEFSFIFIIYTYNTLHNSRCTVTYHPSQKISRFDEKDMRDTAGEVRTNSKVMYSCGNLHTDEQGLGDKLEPIYNNLVLIQDVAWKICWE